MVFVGGTQGAHARINLMSDILFSSPVLAISGRDLMAYASIFFAVIGIVLFFKYLPRWLGWGKPKPTPMANDPAAGLAAGMDLQAELKRTMQEVKGAQTTVEASPISLGATPPTTEPPGQILVLEKGIQHGPFNAAQVQEMMAGGIFSPESLCWQPGQAEWLPLKQVLGPAS